MNHTTGAQRYNKRKDDIFANAHRIESERLANGEKPNPNLTEKKKEIAGKMSLGERNRNGERLSWAEHKQRLGTKSQKGKESLNIPKGEKNENNKMMEGKNENNRW
jgi:hypothetical protein